MVKPQRTIDDKMHLIASQLHVDARTVNLETASFAFLLIIQLQKLGALSTRCPSLLGPLVEVDKGLPINRVRRVCLEGLDPLSPLCLQVNLALGLGQCLRWHLG